jgi:hypothetical protein
MQRRRSQPHNDRVRAKSPDDRPSGLPASGKAAPHGTLERKFPGLVRWVAKQRET